MGEITKVVGQWIAANVPWAVLIGVFIFCLFFEISKIKVYPLKWLWKLISLPFKKIDEQRTESFKNITAALKTDLEQKMDEMIAGTSDNCEILKNRFDKLESRFDSLDESYRQTEGRLNGIERKQDESIAARIRAHVLNFADDLRKGNERSEEDYDNILEESDEYDTIVEKYKLKNNKYTKAIAYIRERYDIAYRTNGFAVYGRDTNV